MTKICRGLCAVSLAVLWGTASARADIQVTATVVGGGTFTTTFTLTPTASGNYTSGDIILGGVTFAVQGNTNSPGNPLAGQLSTQQTEVMNLGSLLKTVTITTRTTPSQAFTMPGSDGSVVTLTSTASTTNNSPLLNPLALSLQSFSVDKFGSTVSPGPQVLAQASNSTLSTAFIRGASYPLINTQIVTLVAFQSSVSNVTETVTAGGVVVPEPSTIVAALFGLPILALGRRLRRSMKAA